MRHASNPQVLVLSPTRAGADKMARLLSDFKSLDVIGSVTDLEAAIDQIEKSKPDLVLLSKRFRGLPDYDLLMAVLRENDIRWLELSSRSAQPAKSLTVSQPTSGLFEIDANTPPEVLVRQIQAVCRNVRTPAQAEQNTTARLASHPFHDKIILIGASTGGVDCLLQVLSNFTVDAPPTLIVQHTGNDFMSSLITLLDRRSPVKVVAAEDGMPVRPGQVCVAGDGAKHLSLTVGQSTKTKLAPALPICGHRPSVDALFHSAVPHAKNVVAALLTGMGRDGAAGLLALRRAGALTIAQDEATSTVYGMPRAAKEINAVDHILSITDIGLILSGRKRLPAVAQGGSP